MLTKNENRFITTVVIRGFKYELWELPNKEPHSLGIMNGESGTLWVKQIDYDFTGNNEWLPWLDKSAKRNCWGIHIKEGNSGKYKWDSYNIDSHVSVYITLDDENVYEINGRDFDYCYNEARSKIHKLEELLMTWEINLKETSKEKGRKIYYKSMPATIKQIYNSGSMFIKADYTDIDKDYWWDQMEEPWHDEHSLDHMEEDKQSDGIVVDIIDSNIYWNRNDRLSKLNKIIRKSDAEGIA